MADEFGVVQELFLYGFVGFFFSGSPWLPIAVGLALIGRGAGADAFDFVFVLPFSASLGTWVAWIIVDAAQLPPLVPKLAYLARAEVTSKDKADSTDNDGEIVIEADTRQYTYAGGLLVAVRGAIFIFADLDTDVPRNFILALGVALLVFGLLSILVALTLLCTSPVRADQTDARYLFYLTLFLAMPSVYNLTALFLRPFQGLVFLTVLVLLTGLVTLLEVRTIGVGSLGQSVMLEGDPRFVRAERYSVGIARRWLLLLLAPLIIVYTVGWIVDEASEGSVRRSLVAILVVSLVVAGLAYCCCRRTPALVRSAEPDELANGDALTAEEATRANRKRRGKGVVLASKKQDD